MKSSFLLFLILGALLTSSVFGQTKPKKAAAVAPKKTTTTSTPAASQVAEAPKTSFDKFYERLSVGYFGVLTSPPLKKWDSRYASLSPEFSGGDPCVNCDTYSANLWSQFNFAYNFGGKMKFNLLPRFTTFFDEAPAQGQGQRGTVLIEDMLIGFSGVIVSSEDKKFNWWMRPALRLPTSKFVRDYNQKDDPRTPEPNDGFGRITTQVELLNSFTYDFNPKFQLGFFFSTRYWIHENRWNHSRNRLYSAPNFTYTINDTTKISAYYEHMLENNKNWKSINGKNPIYYDVWQNAYIGVMKDITPKLNVYPYISAYVNDVPFSTRSFFLGAWISYTIK